MSTKFEPPKCCPDSIVKELHRMTLPAARILGASARDEGVLLSDAAFDLIGRVMISCSMVVAYEVLKGAGTFTADPAVRKWIGKDDTHGADRKDATRDQYVPGQWECHTCGFQLVKSVIAPNGAFVNDNEEYEACPNDGDRMERLTWESHAKGLEKAIEGFVQRACAAEAEVESLKAERDRMHDCLTDAVNDREEAMIRAALICYKLEDFKTHDIPMSFGLSRSNPLVCKLAIEEGIPLEQLRP